MSSVPPHSEELERAVLAAILVYPERLINGDETFLKPGIFHKGDYRNIAEAMVTLLGKEIPPDQANVITQLRETGKLPKVGGAFAITGLPEWASINLKADLARLHEIAQKRQLREAAIQLASQDFEQHTIGEIRDQIDRLFHLSVEGVKSLIGVIEEPMSVHEMVSDKTPQPPEIMTGILPREAILLIYGEPGTGKTLLVIQISLALA